MRNSKKILVIILIISVFLIGNKIRVSANSNEDVLKSNLNIENLIEYINNLDLTEEEIENISEKSKTISQDIKEKASFKDYKITEVIKIYKNFTSISNTLKLNIEFSIKNGDFILKDKANGNSIFKGNVSEIENYFNVIKNNTDLLITEVLANVDNESLKEKIEDVIYENSNSDKNLRSNDNLSNNEETGIAENDTNLKIENNEDIYSNENSLYSNKLSSNIIIPTSILVLAFFVIIISYIKFK